ncbi:MAG: prepilin-type N-terminal cleavage/methylation domain-containing protein [Planctomycetes bacterium]|nr:prepilin-type N-terminal cleavage/methylation domain-containing protein [Planctomycetota bacterium]
MTRAGLRASSRRPFAAPSGGPRAGFTLAEIIVTLIVASFLLTMLLGFYVQIVSGIQDTNRVARPLRIGPTILDLITTDLQACYVYGYERDYFEGEDDGDRDKIKFISSVKSKYTFKGRASDVTEVGYFAEQGRGPFLTLFRREDFFIDQKPLLGGKKQKLYDRVIAFDCKYYKKPEDEKDRAALFTEEHDAWKADQEEALPIAVKVRLVIQPTGEEFDESAQRLFETVIALPDYGVIKNPYKDMPADQTPEDGGAATTTPAPATTGGTGGASPGAGALPAAAGALPGGGGR